MSEPDPHTRHAPLVRPHFSYRCSAPRPEAKFSVGPVVENGFYYDIDLGGGQKLSEEDFPK